MKFAAMKLVALAAAKLAVKLLNATLEKAGGKLSDMVQMTVFITDALRRPPHPDPTGNMTISPAAPSSPSPPWPFPTPRSKFKATPSSAADAIGME
jgi:hypothetical protein